MTPHDAFLIVVGFVVVLWLATVMFEQTAVGQRLTARALRWFDR